GFRVLRFWNNDVLQNIDTVVEAIWIALQKESIPHPLPSPPLEGEEDWYCPPLQGEGDWYCPPLEGEGDCHVSAIWHVTHYKPHRAPKRVTKGTPERTAKRRECSGDLQFANAHDH
ncbi:MAG: DUF559 domain-containing protein, partial [Rhodocyclaceae bacterium]|nr:DUF559 domain-containing protein [Rhodocyclaceae bacterium]